MYKQETIKPYDGEGDKGQLVEEMFDNIAPTYDTLNHRLSWDIDRHWRRKAIEALLPYKPKIMLDVATGTGDFAILSAEMLRPEKLIGIDNQICKITTMIFFQFSVVFCNNPCSVLMKFAWYIF